MIGVIIPCDVQSVSDGYHTFGELYQHRHHLLLALMKSRPAQSWFSGLHDNGTSLDGWFIAGTKLSHGQISYHLPMSLWSAAHRTGAKCMDRAPEWDGHTSSDVIARLQAFILSEP